VTGGSPAIRTGSVLGADDLDRAVRLAGAMGELGVTRLILARPDAPPRELGARATDLPGELVRALEGSPFEPIELRTETPVAITVRLEADAWTWTTDDAEAAARLNAE